MGSLRPVPSVENLFADSDGFIYSSSRGDYRKLEASHDRYGYLCVRVYRDKKRRKFKVHRLVCEAFYGSPENHLFCACHKDDNKNNNKPENLYWGTPKENSSDAIANGKRENCRGEKHHSAKLTWSEVKEIRALDGVLPRPYLAEHFGVSKVTIHHIMTKQLWWPEPNN